MNPARPGAGPAGRASLRAAFAARMTEAARYWETRRITYNGILGAIVVAWVAATWPHFQPALTPQSFLLILALAAIANAAYCLAYPIDLALQLSRWREAWLRRRWLLWLAGTLAATALTFYWIADEMYPYVAPS